MAFTQIVDDNFTRPNTTPGTALSTTGIGNSWIDVKGGVWRIDNNRAAAIGDDFATLVRPSGESFLEQQALIEFNVPVPSTNFFANTLHRVTTDNGKYYSGYATFSGTNIFVGAKKQLATSGLTDIGTSSEAASIAGMTKIRLVSTVQGSNPTTIKVEAFNVSGATPALLLTKTVSDSEPILQVAGSYGIYYFGAPFYVTRAATYQDPNPSAPAVKVNLDVTDAKYFYPHQGWALDATAKQLQTCNPGNYIKIRFTGSATVSLGVDLGTFANDATVVLSYRLNDSDWTNATLVKAQTSVNLGTGLTPGTTYDLTVMFNSHGNNSVANRWTGTESLLKFGAVSIDEGGTFLTPATRPRKALFYGDSITEGWYLLTSGFPDGSSARDDYLTYIAEFLDTEYGVAAFGSQGWLAQGAGNVPVFSTTWNSFYNGRSRLTSGAYIGGLDFIFVNQGTNDGNSDSVGLRNTMLTTFQAMRTAAGSNCRIIAIQPFGQYSLPVLPTVINSYLSSSSDKAFYLIDLGVSAARGLTTFGQGSTLYSTDGLHPNRFGHSRLASMLIGRISRLLSPKIFSSSIQRKR